MPRPVEVDLTVVRERGGAPIAGSLVELVRRWPSSPEITVRSTVQPFERFRVQTPENPIAMGWMGGLALLLADGTTDGAGRVHLRAPPGEPLALRLLGPGHTPAVRLPWSVEAATQPVQRVETVAAGGSIRGRVFPLDAVRRLRVPLPAPGPGIAAPMIAGYGTGLRLRHTVTGETIPPANMMEDVPSPLAEDGTFAIDGLAPGDWQVFFRYSMRMQESTIDPKLAGDPATALNGLGPIEIELPALVNLADGELRVLDVDVSALQPGRMEMILLRNGRPPEVGNLLIQPIGECGAPLPILRSCPNLHADREGRISASLPPGRYAPSWYGNGRAVGLPLADLEVRSGSTTHVDCAIDPVPARFRVVEADGSTPAQGTLLLSRAEPAMLLFGQATDAGGFAAFEELPRGMPMRLSFRRPRAEGGVGAPLDLGAWTATAPSPSPQTLRLPPR
jgi:hypothetical protein